MTTTRHAASDPLAVLRAINADLLGGERIDAAASSMLARLGHALECTGTVFVAAHRPETLTSVATSAPPDDAGWHQDLAAAMAATGDGLVPSVDRDQYSLSSSLRAGDRVLGAVVLSRAAAFEDREVELVAVVVDALALAVDRFRAGELLDRRIAEVTLRQVQLEAEAAGVEAERNRAERLAGQLRDLNNSYLATVRGLAIAIETKDDHTAGHLERLTRYGLGMLRMLAPEVLRNPQYEYGFLLHDIGMLAVPDAVLQKPGELSEAEWELLRGHSAVGYRMLDGIPYLAGAKEIVLAHHERWDGRGYPLGVESFDIPLGARVFPLADAFEAMTSDRPYRQAMSVADALAELRRGGGRQFWPDAVEAFCSMPTDELDDIRRYTGQISGVDDADDSDSF